MPPHPHYVTQYPLYIWGASGGMPPSQETAQLSLPQVLFLSPSTCLPSGPLWVGYLFYNYSEFGEPDCGCGAMLSAHPEHVLPSLSLCFPIHTMAIPVTLQASGTCDPAAPHSFALDGPHQVEVVSIVPLQTLPPQAGSSLQASGTSQHCT